MNITINRLIASGLKGGAFDHEIKPVTVFAGRNASGKTARMEAIRLALAGYVPELGKRNQDTLALAANGSLKVEVWFSDPKFRAIKRTWARDGKTIKASDTVPVEGLPLVMLDPNEYFGLGEKDRMRYVFSLMNVDSAISLDGVKAAIKNIRLDENTEHTEAAVRDVVELVGRSKTPDLSAQQWITSLIDQLKSEGKNTKAAAESMTGMVSSMTMQQAGEVLAPASDRTGAISRLMAEIADLNGKLGGVRREMQRAAADGVQYANAVAELSQIDVKSLEASIASAELTRAQLTDMVEKHVPAVAVNSSKVAGLKKDVDQFKSDIAEQKSEFNQADEDLVNWLKKDKCPTCGSRSKGWRDRIEEDVRARMKVIDDEINGLQKQLNDTTVELRAAEVALAAAIADNAAHMSRLCQVSDLRAEIEANKARIGKAKILNEIIARGAPASATDLASQANEIQVQMTKRQDELAKQTEINKRWIKEQQDAKRVAQALQQRDLLTAKQVVLKEAIKVVERIQTDVVDSVGTKLIERANLFVTGILKTDLDMKDGELGRWDGGSWISHRVFSGTEKALAYAGLCAALSSISPFKLVMIDELTRLDSENKAKLLARMVDLEAKGTINQFIGADTVETTCAGVEFIKL